MNTPPVLINGRPGHWIDVFDRGFQYGDGLFETLLVAEGRPFLWPEHVARLERGCGRLAIPMPDPALLWHEALRLCREKAAGVLKILVTRGTGGRGYRPPAPALATRVLSLHPLPADIETWRRQGIRIRLCRTPLGINPFLAGIKHCNRLEQILARSEWDDPEIQEGLMCDSEGCLVEGTLSNLFWLRQGKLCTPKIDRCGIAGIVRSWVMEKVGAWGEGVTEVRVSPEALLEAEEVFVTNSVLGIVPVTQWACRDRHWPVGGTTRRLQRTFRP